MEFEKKRNILEKKKDDQRTQKRNALLISSVSLIAALSICVSFQSAPQTKAEFKKESEISKSTTASVDYSNKKTSDKKAKIETENKYASKSKQLYEQSSVIKDPEQSSEPEKTDEESVAEESSNEENTASYQEYDTEEVIDDEENDYETENHLNSYDGIFYGPSGFETYYNMPMDGVVSVMRNIGFDEENYPYWIREDGCKMLGDYIMVAADLDIRPRGSFIETSLGTGLVCDTGGFIYNDPYQLDIAVTW